MAEWESYGYNNFIVYWSRMGNCLSYFDNEWFDSSFEGRPLCTLIKEGIHNSDYRFVGHPLAILMEPFPIDEIDGRLVISNMRSYDLFFPNDPFVRVPYEGRPLHHALIKVTAAGMKRRWEQRERDVKAADELKKHPALCDDVIGIIKSFLANPK